MPIPLFPSTKSGFLCAFGVENPCFQVFRAQNQGFCALLPSETPIFRPSEHKIEVFVSEMAIFPGFAPFQAQNQHFCAREEGKVESESVTAKTLTLPANHRARFQNANTS